jgi:hypothetical protein
MEWVRNNIFKDYLGIGAKFYDFSSIFWYVDDEEIVDKGRLLGSQSSVIPQNYMTDDSNAAKIRGVL